MTDLLDELRWRGQLYQATDEAALAAHLGSGPRRVYCGFDPTADSLTIGNLVPMMLLRRFRASGHEPIVLMGGATGRIGDPSGKDAERQLMTDERVETHIAAQRTIFERVLGGGVTIVNNYDWFRGIGFIEALRDIGKHFSVNQMIQRDSVRRRLEDREHGISFTEFSYMLLQAYDYLHLFREMGVTIQCAGSDQWGNIVSGVDLIRRVEGLDDAGAPRAFGMTAPLLTKADGGKFGKTESGAIWLSDERPSGEPGTGAYGFYQFWINADDADVPHYLRIFTDLSRDEVESLEAEHAAAPHERRAQRAIAEQATRIVHGDEGLARAERATAALFSGDVAGLDERTLTEAFASAPSSEHDRALLAGEGVALVELLPETTLARSRREAKEFLQGGAVSVNGEKVGIEDRLTADRLLHGRVALLRRGKRAWHVTRWG
jgi:tyrosyl-tRNA synthetase